MTRTFSLKGKTYSPSNILIIAELGTGHRGNTARAKELVDAAALAGADCIKVQIVYADEILHPATGTVPLPGGNIKLYDVFKTLEAPINFYAELKDYAESKGLLFLASPFGRRSAQELFCLSPDFVKVASPELNYTELLQTIAAWHIPALLSSGVSTLADIENALHYFDRTAICLLHCVTAYPAPESDYNLTVLRHLSGIFGVSVGISDHSLDPVIVPTLAVANGACLIEKHFCLSRGDSGLDDPIALPPKDFLMMSNAIRRAQKRDSISIIEDAKITFGVEKVNAVLGDGVKKLSGAEENNYLRTNRSIHALIEIKEGDMFTRDTIAVLRTEKVLRPGLPPSFFEMLLGRAARRIIPAGQGVLWDDVL
ncbi:MAG: N-acetylneuraminate synthase family protein [Spirochaetaceae bacterium]|jgi:sialic acid synthase SpsE|nr:N-acetylneuraminate synthase family protein [Spirochaetaceae bacterium]